MKRTVVDCDGCGTPDMKDFHSVHFVVGTQIDSPSGRTEEVEETLEFCTKCLGRIAQEAIKTRSMGDQKMMYERWVKQKGKAQESGDTRPGMPHYAPAGVVYRERPAVPPGGGK